MGNLPKPPACQGCPFYSRGLYWVPDEVVERAPVFIMGQNPGKEEEAAGRPYVGKTGQMQESHFFPLAGLQRGGVSIGNAIRCRLDGGNRLPPLESREVRDAVMHCTRAHLRVPSGARLVVTQGEYALWAATSEGLGVENGVANWRGWLLPFAPAPGPPPRHRTVWTPGPRDLAVLATWHLAFLFREPRQRVAAQRDWCKVPLVLRGSWPVPLPPITPHPPATLAGKWAFDSEWDEHTGELTYYSLYSGTTGSLHVVRGPERLVVLGRPHIVFHNTQADLANWERLSGLRWGEYDVDDTMYKHAALWGGMPHTLDFTSSLYARTNRWKHLQHINVLHYSGGDALGTWDVDEGLDGEFSRDPASRWVYDHLQHPLAGIIYRARQKGIRLHQPRVSDALVALDAVRAEQEVRAQAAVGWPINLGSNPQVGYQLYKVEQLKTSRGRISGGRPRKRAG